MIISKYFLFFFIYATLGWLFECSYGVIVTGKWENRGFLYGPIVPIYGVGAVTITVLCDMMNYHGIHFNEWHIFIVSFIGSIILEYGTGWFLENRFHAVWWDYSNLPFNIHGRICLPASIAFGIAGVLITGYLAPWLLRVTAGIPELLIEALSLVAMAILAADTTLTVVALTGFERMVAGAEAELNSYMENKVETLHEKAAEVGSKIIDEKDRLFTERVEYLLRNVNMSRLMALSRVRGFRRDKTKKNASLTLEYMNKALGVVKDKVFIFQKKDR